jgi:hypothetical protein
MEGGRAMSATVTVTITLPVVEHARLHEAPTKARVAVATGAFMDALDTEQFDKTAMRYDIVYANERWASMRRSLRHTVRKVKP